MSRVLVGHSYFLRFDPKLWKAMQPYPPLGTLYAAALLRQAGHDVSLFDAMLEPSTKGWEEMLDTVSPDVAILFEDNFNYLSKMCLLNMRVAAFEMIGAAKSRGCRIIVCRADVTDNAQTYLSVGADFAAIGEADETVLELVHALESGNEDIAAIPGVVYKTESAETVSTDRRPVMRELDSLPEPARDLIDLGKYRAAWQRHGRFSMNLVSSRGCSFHCNWCAKPIWGQRHNVRSPASVAAEIETLRKLGVDHVWFMDDILGIKPGWLAQFSELIQKRKPPIPFKCLSRADLLLRDGEIDALRKADCETVWIGAESGSQKILDAMEKGTTVAQTREVTKELKDNGIRAAFFLQFGYPGETWNEVQETLQLVRDCEPDDIGMSVSYPLPGTPFFERVKDSMREGGNWTDSQEMPMLFDSPYSTAFYHRLHDTLHTEFRIKKVKQGGNAALRLLDLMTRGRVKDALGFVRDISLLPVQRARLNQERRRTRHFERSVPAELSRSEAGEPSIQEDDFDLVRAGARAKAAGEEGQS